MERMQRCSRGNGQCCDPRFFYDHFFWEGGGGLGFIAVRDWYIFSHLQYQRPQEMPTVGAIIPSRCWGNILPQSPEEI